MNLEERIDRYFRGEMSESEAAAFMKEIDVDQTLRAHFEEEEALIEGIAAAGLRQKMNQLKEAGETGRKGEAKVISLSMVKKLAVAASLALIAGFYFWNQNNASNTDHLFANHFVEDPGLPTVMGGLDKDYEFNEAMVDYKSANYPAARDRWNGLLEKKPGNDTLMYYIAMTHLNEGDVNTTEKILSENNLRQSAFAEDVKWYLALIYIKKGDLRAARSMLAMLTSPRAEKLKNELKPDAQ